ncbi:MULTISPECIES: LacI family DNA-binding transcriptional regulator [unclassified Cryobacterium]|uniref:LacI family DNA-binding transcriptional regulator n=1 Tax=unclassified Cryobacterium TaxID=2649013 RepID=UPI002AB39648|nr:MULTISPECIES: LacI family DNA-binding transcriptional regulator [unclassified Cryobacterium]MDY7543373.1 LacI family DNA-binding transcriptional regulator [Cryobacterium sp. 5B3]MEA9999692.1 LacI family DNA-binding transcriptional regulator [Cryobacterium sp. RTS3]MEB0264982.1 LacI family DNA-binding transcriptional regulator [Cryobacterium sp. 10I5]MEB0274695.1 LacI family DNA-binding transcriptional regulator [Cryobacterium sp. 5B3]
MMNKRVGIRDVAAAAGVSVTTVSHSLSGGGVLPESTRKRVQIVARELGYAPNRLASGLRNQRSQTIGFVSDEIATTPFAGAVVLGAQEAAAAHDWVLMVVNSNLDAELESREMRALMQHQVDGIIFARMYHQNVVVPPMLANIPTVLLDAESDDNRFASVVPDEEAAARTAVEYLVRAGHTRIGYLTNQDDIPATRGRLEGYRNSIRSYGLPLDESLIVTAAPSAAGGREAALSLLDRTSRPTALFCFNDLMAMGAYQAAGIAGLSVPRELSIVGIDNLELIAGSLFPGLTTVALPHYAMGQWAITRLHAEINGDSANEPRHVRLHCPLVERFSVAPPLP